MIPNPANPKTFSNWIAQEVKIPSIRRSFIAGVGVTAGMAVYMSADGKVYPYATSSQDAYIGVAERRTTPNCAVTVVMAGFLRVENIGWQAGQIYYAQNGGVLGLTGDIKVGVGVCEDGIVVLPGSSGTIPPVTQEEGYAKSLMLMGG